MTDSTNERKKPHLKFPPKRLSRYKKGAPPAILNLNRALAEDLQRGTLVGRSTNKISLINFRRTVGKLLWDAQKFKNKAIFVLKIAEMDTLSTVVMGQETDLKLITDSAKDFANKRIKPSIMDWDEAQYFPTEVMQEAVALGFLGLLIPTLYGGSGLGYHEYVL